MKKKILLVVLPLLFIACKKENDTTVVPNTTIQKMVDVPQQITKDSTIASQDQPETTTTAPSETPLEIIDRENNEFINDDDGTIQKASIDPRDSSIWIVANMREDHRIFGYEKPSTESKRMFLLSIFTNDVKNNPFHLPYGAYYGTDEMKNSRLKFNSYQGKFIKAELLKDNQKKIIYFESKLMEFE